MSHRGPETRAVRYAVLVPGPLAQRDRIGAGLEPRRDYLDLADALGARIIEVAPLPVHTPLTAGLAATWTAFRRRDEYDVLVTLAERAGLPVAIALSLAGVRRGHVMISHWMSPPKKRVLFRWLRSRHAIDRIVAYSSAQERFALEELHFTRRQVEMVLHAADSQFWRPLGNARSGICSAGLEHRDYPTLIEAVRGLDLPLTIAAADAWSAHDPIDGSALPPNVTKLRADYRELRDLYDRSEFVVVPLHDADFQAGSLVMYEAMAMGKAVIATRTRAQRYGNILREGETGLLVPPSDPKALRDAILRLHRHPAEARRMGANARLIVDAGLNHDAYIHTMVEIVRGAGAEIYGDACGDRRAIAVRTGRVKAVARRLARPQAARERPASDRLDTPARSARSHG